MSNLQLLLLGISVFLFFIVLLGFSVFLFFMWMPRVKIQKDVPWVGVLVMTSGFTGIVLVLASYFTGK